MDLTIEKLVYGGEGLARVNGEVIFTPFVLPGEGVTVERQPSRKGAVRARLVEVREPSPDRVKPPCAVFGKCGGCQYQHIDYPAQLSLKRNILAETLRRGGGIEFGTEQIEVLAGEPWGYRNRVQFHIENDVLGYRAMGSHRLVAATACPIGSPKINEALTTLREMARNRRWPGFVRSIEIFTDEDQLQWNVLETDKPLARGFFEWLAEEIPGTVDGALDYRVGTDLFQVNGKAFFQVNRFLVPELAKLVCGDLTGGTAWDLYAGVGLFSIPMARRFGRVIAVESGRAATKDLKQNARTAGMEITSEEKDTDTFLAEQAQAPDVVIADPPRQGLGKHAVGRLLELKPATIVLVACDPATLARDLAALTAEYRIAKITMADLFPQTYHLETVVRLELK